MTANTAVVITCFELGATLPDAVASATSQTLTPPEIVVVDDGSKDALTLQVIGWLEAHEPRVHLIRTEHRGAAHARNIGVAHTTAPAVVFLDGDDMLEPTYLAEAEAVLRARPDLSFVCCELQAFGRASYRWRPPPYSVAEAVGRGACGHISTVFRRNVWETVGGFDESLPAYEDVDFWLRVLEAGFRGHILDDALLRYRVRSGSRYHSAIVREEYVPAKELLLDKHWDDVSDRGLDVFATLLDFQRELTGHAQSLEHEGHILADALDEAEHEIGEIGTALAASGIPRFDWGRLAEPLPLRDMERKRKIDRHYVRRATNDLLPEGTADVTVTITPGAEWPDPRKPRYDSLLVKGALEFAPNPGEALACCRAALRPGGVLVVVASTMAVGEGCLRGFTEASIRSLLCDLFPPAEVSVASYGNLMGCVGTVAGVGLSEATAQERDADDPAYPAIVAASARAPVRGRAPRFLRRAAAPPRIPALKASRRHSVILAYHRVAVAEPDVHGLCVAPDLFEEQMRLVAEEFEPMALDDLAEAADAGDPMPGSVAVTFDDGYLDNLTAASPVLVELGIPATFFVNAPPAAPREAWWDTAERIFLGERPIPERLSIPIGASDLRLPTRTRAERRSALFAVHARLLDAGPAEIADAERRLVAWGESELAARDSHRLMTADEVMELSRLPGHRIGSHGLNHLRLPAHAPDVQSQELRNSKAVLEELLGNTISAIAYPYGSCDHQTTLIAEEAGFGVGCTVEGDPVGPRVDPLRLPRVEVPPTPAAQLRFRLEQLMADQA
jgi:peptidoglycan/xylan/chitin deacetylase (PgdA/CDA1 family)